METMAKSETKIRVLHIITRLIPGGADENTVQTVLGLDKERFQVDLIVGGQSDELMMRRVERCRVIIVPELVRNPSPLKDLKTCIKLIRLIRQERYHIVHTHTAKAGIIGRFAAWFCRVPIIVHTLHGATFHRALHPGEAALYRALERLAARVSHKLVSVGDDLRRIYLDAGVGKPRQYVTIRSGFEIARFRLSDAELALRRRKIRRELSISDDAWVIGSASRLEPRKGQFYFLQSAQRLLIKYPDLVFIIAGDGPSAKELRTLAHSLRIANRVQFLGHRTDIEDVMSAMDIFVLSSLWEGLPQVLVQAAALGRPIVSFDAEGAKEIVHGGENGFVVPRGDENALTESLAYLIAHPQRAREMGVRGRRFIGEEYDKEIMVRRIDKLYRELLLQAIGRGGRARALRGAKYKQFGDLTAQSIKSLRTQQRQMGKPGLN
jgi:glycosyltransferase involved in cell wall biosynthesis